MSAAALLTMMNPATASAAYWGAETDYTANYVPDRHWHPADDLPGVRVYFAPEGDWFRVEDTRADTYAAAVEWHAAGRTGTCVNKLGSGSDGACNKDLDEDYPVFFRATLYDEGILVGWTGEWTSSRVAGY